MRTRVAFLLLLALSPGSVPAICTAGTPTVACVNGTEDFWRVTWGDQSGCGCGTIEFYARACGSDWQHIATLHCSATEFYVCGGAGQWQFKILYLRSNGTKSVADVVTSCLACS